MGDHRDVIRTLFALMADVMKADVMTPNSTGSLNQELIKSQPEEVVTKEAGLEADVMTPNSIVSLNQELINSQPEAVVTKEAELEGLEQDGVNFEVTTREKKRTANLLPSANSEEEMATSITRESSTQTHCDNKRIRTQASPDFKGTTTTSPRKDVMTRMTARAVIKTSEPNLAGSTSTETLAPTQTVHEELEAREDNINEEVVQVEIINDEPANKLKLVEFNDQRAQQHDRKITQLLPDRDATFQQYYCNPSVVFCKRYTQTNDMAMISSWPHFSITCFHADDRLQLVMSSSHHQAVRIRVLKLDLQETWNPDKYLAKCQRQMSYFESRLMPLDFEEETRSDILFEPQRAGGFPKITRLPAHQKTTNEYVSGDWDYVEYEAKLREGLLQVIQSHGILGCTMKIVVRVGKCFLKFNGDQISRRVTAESEELSTISLSIPTIQRVIKSRNLRHQFVVDTITHTNIRTLKKYFREQSNPKTYKEVHGLAFRKIVVHFADKKYAGSSTPGDFRLSMRFNLQDRWMAERLSQIERILNCMDYFQVLSVDYNATTREIHKNYWKILRLVLPDRPRQPAAQVVTQLVHEAYHALMNEESRKFHMSTLPRKRKLCAENSPRLHIYEKVAVDKFEFSKRRNGFITFLREGNGADFRLAVETVLEQAGGLQPDDETLTWIDSAFENRNEDGILVFPPSNRFQVQVVRQKEEIRAFKSKEHKVAMRKVHTTYASHRTETTREVCLHSLQLKQMLKQGPRFPVIAAERVAHMLPVVKSLVEEAAKLTAVMGNVHFVTPHEPN